MKLSSLLLLIFAAIVAVLVGVSNADFTCPEYEGPVVQCFVNPCLAKPCGDDQTCCADYRTGCNRHCFLKSGCPVYEGPQVNCLINPCQNAKCGRNQICCADYRTGCNYHCINQ